MSCLHLIVRFITAPYDKVKADASVKLIMDTLLALRRSPEGEKAVDLDRYLHPKMMWYGSAGIGTMRRIAGFHNWHQIAFLKAMPERHAFLENGVMFGDGEYVGFIAWSGGIATLS